MPREIPAKIIKEIIEQWASEYGPTFPLYGNNTVRHDISGSVRPLLSSTEIPHTRILSESSGVSKKAIQKIMSGDTEFISEELADILLTAMDRAFEFYSNPDLAPFR